MDDNTESGFSTSSSSTFGSSSNSSTAISGSSAGSDASSSNPSAIIGSKIRIKGELIGEEDLIIQGCVEGTIDLKDNNLTIGKDGVLKANASAKVITIEGDVEGDLFGEERIVILESSNVRGNLVADRVSLEDGAKFRGSIDMDVSAKNPDLLKSRYSENTETSSAPLNEITEPEASGGGDKSAESTATNTANTQKEQTKDKAKGGFGGNKNKSKATA